METGLTFWRKELRDWQEEAFRRFMLHEGPNFLAVATPGAGKTTLALRIAHELLSTNKIERVVVVCPTDYLRIQWDRAASEVGIHLDSGFRNGMGTEGSDFHGIVVTYQSVASFPDLYRDRCKKPTLVIFDEIHHAGQDRTWGGSLRHAFYPALYRLAISGTPFRSDNSRIPYIQYDPDTLRSIADYNYGYGDALRDDYCRSVIFPAYEGTVEWLSNTGQFITSSFADDLDDEGQVSERLRAALSTSGDWLLNVIKEADAKLTELRHDHPDAAGLIIAMNQPHAKEIAGMMRSPVDKGGLGLDPMVVVSEDGPEAAENLKSFKNGRGRWLIAVKMASEGVDVPRWRILVYATNVLTELFFRQAVGRIVRRIKGAADEDAYVYIPADERLIEFARRIKIERDHELREMAEHPERLRANGFDRQPSLFDGRGTNPELDKVVYDAGIYTTDELEQGNQIKRQVGAPSNYDPIYFARAARLFAEPQTPVAQPVTKSAIRRDPTMRELLDMERRTIKQLVGNLHYKTNLEFSDLNSRVNRVFGHAIDKADLAELRERVKLLGRWMEAVNAGRSID